MPLPAVLYGRVCSAKSLRFKSQPEKYRKQEEKDVDLSIVIGN